MAHDADFWIARLGLIEHPEGGYYRESFRSADEIQTAGLPPRYGSSRSFSTAIYFLLKSGEFSALHRIESDEVWHHYAGSALTLHVLEADGQHRTELLGPDPERGEMFQVAIPARRWFAATVNAASSFALVGCTVAPGFSFQDFELGDRATLVARFPQHRALIETLTRSGK